MPFFDKNVERKNLAGKVASLLFSSLLFLPGTSQIAVNVSNLIKLPPVKKISSRIYSFINQVKTFSLLKESQYFSIYHKPYQKWKTPSNSTNFY